MKRYLYLTHIEPFQAIKRGEKTFEIRRLNKEIKVGDTLELVEIYEETEAVTGEVLLAEVTYIIHGGQYGIPEDRMIMSIVLLN